MSSEAMNLTLEAPADPDPCEEYLEFRRALRRWREELELRRAFVLWFRERLRNVGIVLPENVDPFEDPSMLEENLNEWRDAARQEGLQEGRKEGRQAGQIEGMRQILLHQLEQRFGTLPSQVRRKMRSFSSTRRLEEISERVLVARSLEEMGLG